MADVFASAPPLDGLTFDEFASKPSTDDLFGSFWSELTGSPVSSHSAEGSPSYIPSSPNNDAHSSVLFEGFDPSGTFSTQMTLEPIIAKLDVLSSDGKKKRPHPSQCAFSLCSISILCEAFHDLELLLSFWDVDFGEFQCMILVN
jgi:hypothetical protein